MSKKNHEKKKFSKNSLFRMHPRAVLPRAVTEWPEAQWARIVRVAPRDVQSTLKTYPSPPDLRFLKRIKPTGNGEMDILVGRCDGHPAEGFFNVKGV